MDKNMTELILYGNDDVAKYRKKKSSNKSKSRAKADHKHDNVECLLVHDNRPYYASYCSICGKINNWTVPCFTVQEAGVRRMMTSEEVFEKYKDLPKIQVDDLWAKYIPI